MFKNITDLRTTLPTLIGAILTLLGISGLIDTATIPELSDALVALGFSVLTIVGLFSKSK